VTDDSLSPIRDAIAQGNDDHARALIREELQRNPNADVYYLAYQVALNDYQQRKFLKQALDIDPFHEDATQALNRLESGNDAPIKPRQETDDPFSEVSKEAMSSPITVSKPKRTVSTGGFSPQPTNSAGSSSDVNAPAQSATAYELATFGQRFGAWLIDVFIQVIVLVAIIIFTGGISLDATTPPSELNSMNNSLNLFFQLFSVVFHLYFLTQRNGQTPGKMAIGIRIVKKDGSDLSYLDAFLRNVVGYQLSGFVLFLGYFWSLWDSETQTWHDKIVRTVVVKT